MRKITKHIRNNQSFILVTNSLKKLKHKKSNTERTALENMGSAIGLRFYKQKTMTFNRTGHIANTSIEGFMRHIPTAKHEKYTHMNLPPDLRRGGDTAIMHNRGRLEGKASVPLSIKTQNIDIDFQIVHVPDFTLPKGQSP